MEHAWGAASRFDLGESGRAWHWDVLAMEDGSFCAGLALEELGGSAACTAAGGSARAKWSPFAACACASKMGSREEAASWGWRGAMRLGRAVLRYEARASTPVAPEVRSGGFLGVAAFDGEVRADGGSGRSVRGTGFCEYRAREP